VDRRFPQGGCICRVRDAAVNKLEREEVDLRENEKNVLKYTNRNYSLKE